MDWVALLVSKGVPAASFVVAVGGAWIARRSAQSARESAAAAERSAATSEAAHKLALQPYVVAEVVRRTRVVGPTERTPAEIVLVNRGNGLALNVAANLSMTHGGADTRLQVSPCSALGKGDEHVVPGMPSTGSVELWGEVTCQDAEGGAYRVGKAKGEETWRPVE